MKSDALQSLLDRQTVIETVVRLGRALDDRDWLSARECLGSELDTDYSSFRGTPPTRLKAEEFIHLRQAGLDGLKTQHLSIGHVVESSGNGAICCCEFVIHRWPADVNDQRFFHSYGSYVYRLRCVQGQWQIVGITQVIRRNEGDPQLHGALRRPGDNDV